MTYIMTRIASHGQTNPFPLPETAHLTPAERAEFTFTLELLDKDVTYLVKEEEARRIYPLAEHLAVGSAFAPIN